MRRRQSILPLVVVSLLIGCAPPAPEPEEVVQATGVENGSFTADLNGVLIHYEVHGQGPVVITVPNSWGLTYEGLRALYRPLEERLTMVYFDPRGMGESGPIRQEEDMGLTAVRADFDALRRHLGLETVHAIGWSNGAMNLILLASELPETLASAIFVHGVASFTEEDTQVWADEYPELMKAYLAFQQEMADEAMPVEEKTARQRDLWIEEFFPAMLADPEAGRAMLEELYTEAEFSRPHAAYADRETPVFDARDQLADITARSLVIAGAHDMMPPEKVSELHGDRDLSGPRAALGTHRDARRAAISAGLHPATSALD